jgi:hypothetical protein
MSKEPGFERLPCKLTDIELKSRGLELGHKLSELNDLEAKKKAAASTFSSAIKEVNAKIHELGETQRTGTEYRQVEVREERAFESNLIKIVRRDTGEQVRTRAMTGEERQEELFAGHTRNPDDDESDLDELDSPGTTTTEATH